MVYKPTLADIPDEPRNTSYVPSIADIPEEQSPGLWKTIGNDLWDVAKGLGSKLERGASDIDVGAAQMVRDISSLPSRLIRPFSPALAKKIPGIPLSDEEINKMYGVKNPDIYDKLIQGAASFGPLMALPESEAPEISAKLASYAVPGAVYGAATSENPYTGAAEGAATTTALGGAGDLAKALLKKGFQRFSAPGFVKKIGGKLAKARDFLNRKAANQILDNLDNHETQAQNAWDNVEKMLQEPALNRKFDDASYRKSLKEIENEIKEDSKQSGLALQNKGAQEFLDAIKGDKINNIADAFQHNKALNAYYRNEISPGINVPFNTIKRAKNALTSAIDENLEKQGLDKVVGKAWQDAKNATKRKNQIFKEVINSSQKPGVSPIENVKVYGHPYGDITEIVSKYIPSSKAEGIEKMKQLAAMMGDEAGAKNVIKHNHFKDSFIDEEPHIEPKKFLNRYNKLSKEQQDYLFSNEQNNNIQALNRLLRKNPDALAKTKWNPFWFHGALPGLAGSVIGPHFGVNPLTGALAGVAGAQGGKILLQKLLSNPRTVDAVTKDLLQSRAIPGNRNFSKNLRKKLLQGLIYPTAINAENQ